MSILSWETVYLLLAGEGDTGSEIPSLSLAVVAGPIARFTWEDAVADEIGYSLERRDVTAAGAFAEVAAVGPGIETVDDAGPFTAGHVYEYRLIVEGGALDGESSNLVRYGGAGGITVVAGITNCTSVL